MDDNLSWVLLDSLRPCDLALCVEAELGVVAVVVIGCEYRNHECNSARNSHRVDHGIDLVLVVGLRELTHNTSLCL